MLSGRYWCCAVQRKLMGAIGLTTYMSDKIVPHVVLNRLTVP